MSLFYKAAAEIGGTFMMVFFGAGSIVLAEKFPQFFPAFCIPIVWGLIIMLMIFSVAHISGAHFNPAVTLAFAVAKRIPARQILLYWPSQFVGSVAAIQLLGALQKG